MITKKNIPEDIKEFCIELIKFKNKVKYKSAQEFIWNIICFSNLYRKNEYLTIMAINQFRSFIQSYINTYNTKDLNDLCSYINVNYEVNSLYLEPENTVLMPGVELMTVHNSKGKEFNTVFIPFLSSASFPMNFKNAKILNKLPNNWKRWINNECDDRMLHTEEERRLFYVGITRAKNNLFLLTTNKRRSKFILEIDTKLYIEEDIFINSKENNKKNSKGKAFKKLYNNLLNNNYKDVSNKLKINLSLRPQNLSKEIYFEITKEYENLLN